MEDQSRRSDRNENILRQLDRIDYQASALAAKTDRLKALKVKERLHKKLTPFFLQTLFYRSLTFPRTEAIRKIFIEFVEPETTRTALYSKCIAAEPILECL